MQITREVADLIDRALGEDLGTGDLTTDILVVSDLMGKATLVSREPGVLAGAEVGLEVFRCVDRGLVATAFLGDGAALEAGSRIATIEGRVGSILSAERTAVNFVQHLSGIATETSKYVAAVSESKARIVDTRKTTPGLRILEKYAVRVGGGNNHRRNLGDGILIKDNHIEALASRGASLADVVREAVRKAPHTVRVEVEIEDLEQLGQAIDGGAEIVLLDNMEVGLMARAVELARGRVVTEASGGITLENVQDVAATGVDIISIGALTHSARSLNISLDMVT